MLHRPSRIGLPMSASTAMTARTAIAEGKSRPGVASPCLVGVLALATVLLASFARIAAAETTSLEDAASDRILASTVVPDPMRKVGEVRLLARGDAVVVQTLLSTKLLERVIGEIRLKETANWPDDPASVAAYVAALEEVAGRLDRGVPEEPWSDRRRRLLIEFAADEHGEAVLVGTFDRAGSGSGEAVRRRQVLARPSLGRSYVLRNIRLILADSFDVPEQEVDSLGALGPAAAAPPDARATTDKDAAVPNPGAPAPPGEDLR